MAEPSRTVRVSGLPADIKEGRLKDKLLIHFLRARNGGGEIESVTIVTEALVSALITFEDCEVAKTAVEHSPHILEVGGKKYNLSVTEYHKMLDPDKVITRLSAVMDYSRVPGGAQALRYLQEKHPDIHLNYNAALELYTIYGAYSKVQAALTQLFDQSGNPQSDTVQNLQDQTEQSGTVAARSNSSSQRDLTPGGYGVDDAGQREGIAAQLTWSLEEDSLLIVDADMFQYLQKYCQWDYQQVLSVHGVEVVEVTNQGFTSLYLHSAAGVGEDVRHQKSLGLARNAISQFFQENEKKLCRGEFLKSMFSSGEDLETAKDNLRLRHSKILLKEDSTSVYLIGSSRDVCDAKQFLLDQSLEQVVKSEEAESKDDVARRVRLAPRFKESGLSPLGSRPTDFCLRGGLTAQSRPKCSGPMLGFNVLSEPAHGSEKVPRAPPQATAEDILFKSPLSLTASLQNNDTSFHSDLIKSPPKVASPSPSLPDRTPVPPAGSGSTLRRANSFSGTPQRKAELTQQRSQDDRKEFPAAARSPPFFLSDHPSKDRQAGHVAEMAVSLLMWQHIKEAYATQVEDLTSDVQTQESTHAGSNSVTITLRGASLSTLQSCRLGLQRLIDSVGGDLSAHKLPLSELGLADPTDETLLACCNNVRTYFRKVTIQITREHVLIVGPKLICSQVAASLRGVFLTDLTQTSKRREVSVPHTSACSTETLVQTSEDQRAKRSSPAPESSTGTTDGTGIGQERTEHVNVSVSQPRRYKDPVIKEKVKYVGPGDRNGQKSSAFVPKSAARPDEDPSLSAKEGLDSAQKDSAHQTRKESVESRSSTEAEPLQRGIRGNMTFSKLDITIPGHKNDSAIKITYCIPDGIQEEGHPSPGQPFQGGVFEAYLPDSETTMRLLPRLGRAFKRGLTFTMMEKETGAKVTWGSIPHKTSLHGGRSGFGYPDSSYLSRLEEVLSSHGIDEPPGKSK